MLAVSKSCKSHKFQSTKYNLLSQIYVQSVLVKRGIWVKRHATSEYFMSHTVEWIWFFLLRKHIVGQIRYKKTRFRVSLTFVLLSRNLIISDSLKSLHFWSCIFH